MRVIGAAGQISPCIIRMIRYTFWSCDEYRPRLVRAAGHASTLACDPLSRGTSSHAGERPVNGEGCPSALLQLRDDVGLRVAREGDELAVQPHRRHADTLRPRSDRRLG